LAVIRAEMENEQRRVKVRGLRRLQRETGRTRSSVEVSRGPPAQSSSKKKYKKAVSVKKFPVFIEIEGVHSSKFQIAKELFADSRQQKSYGHDFLDFEASLGSIRFFLQEKGPLEGRNFPNSASCKNDLDGLCAGDAKLHANGTKEKQRILKATMDFCHQGRDRDREVWRSAIRCRVEFREGIRISVTRWAEDDSTICLGVASGLPVTQAD